MHSPEFDLFRALDKSFRLVNNGKIVGNKCLSYLCTWLFVEISLERYRKWDSVYLVKLFLSLYEFTLECSFMVTFRPKRKIAYRSWAFEISNFPIILASMHFVFNIFFENTGLLGHLIQKICEFCMSHGYTSSTDKQPRAYALGQFIRLAGITPYLYPCSTNYYCVILFTIIWNNLTLKCKENRFTDSAKPIVLVSIYIEIKQNT